MLKNNSILFLLLFSFCFLPENGTSQLNFFQRKKTVEKTIVNTGSYLGVQSGKLFALEVGVERQWKEKKIKKPQTVAVNMGFNYAFGFESKNFTPVLGYDIGAWRKNDRLSLTYGATALIRSDFKDNYMLGASPFFGYKVLNIVHLRCGYQFLFPVYGSTFVNSNLFLSARVFLRTDKKVTTREIPREDKKNEPKKWFKRD